MRHYHKNPRQITEKQFTDLKKWLRELGDLSGIVHDLNTDEIIGGNQRGRVMDVNKCEVVLTEEPHEPDEQGTVAHGYIVWEGKRYAYRQVRWTEKQCEQANIVANKAGGTWDFDTLANEFEFDDLIEWGFDAKELLGLDFGNEPPAEDPGAQVDKAEELREKWHVETGQLWRIPSKSGAGEHRIICGDCTDGAVVERVLDIYPGICVTDPPYGVNYNPQWRSDAAAEGHLAYAARRVGKVENDDRADWSAAWALFPGDVIYSWHPAGATSLVHAKALQDSGFVIRIQIIWAKSNFPIGRGDYHVRHEPCWYAVRDGKPSRRTDDRTQTTLWEINLDKNVEGGHSTQKPVECMERPIRNHSFDVVYDPSLGSGTTLVACERLGRLGRGIEISPAYVAVSLQRLADMGLEPVLIED